MDLLYWRREQLPDPREANATSDHDDAPGERADAPDPRPPLSHPAQQAAHAGPPDWPEKRQVLSPAGELRTSRRCPFDPRWRQMEAEPRTGKTREHPSTGPHGDPRDPTCSTKSTRSSGSSTAIAGASPRTARFIPVPRRDDGRLDRDRLTTAIRHGFGIVRWHLDPPAT